MYTVAGTYCPTGSNAPIPCPLGQYCDADNLANPTDNCTAGFFCNGSEIVPNPQPCSLGHYCPSGTTYEVPCSPGTFNSMYSYLCIIRGLNYIHLLTLFVVHIKS